MIKISIEGMSCDNCVRHAHEALEALEGVSGVVVSLDPGEAQIEGEAGDEAIRAALDEEGYQATAIVRN
jgi:copper chaperone CopZ